MRVLKTTDLRQLSRAALWTLLRRMSKALANAPRRTAKRRSAARNLRRVRETLERESLPPY